VSALFIIILSSMIAARDSLGMTDMAYVDSACRRIAGIGGIAAIALIK